ncbi:hypothetical protein R3P38DRAFT_2841535, partial [Favolaschia claudopus]
MRRYEHAVARVVCRMSGTLFLIDTVIRLSASAPSTQWGSLSFGAVTPNFFLPRTLMFVAYILLVGLLKLV